MLLIGSQAIKYWYPEFGRIPKDTDYAVTELEKAALEKKEKVEYLVNPVIGHLQGIASVDMLYTIKLSHTVGWELNNHSWARHAWDIQFLKEKGAKLDWELFYKLYDYWIELHGENKRSNLEMSAEEFFNNAIKYPINHDDIHEMLIKHPHFEGQQSPTYTKILKGEVDVCMEKFENLTEKEKFNLVFEEVAVMAEERFPQKMYYKAKYERMLKKFILQHAKLTEAVWILENHKWLLTNIPFNFSKFIQENTLIEA